MAHPSPSMQEWQDLYTAAIEFKRIECWNWMDDSDLFGVQNPLSHEIGYCCVLGALGEVFGLAVYLGAEGVQGYLRVQSGETSLEEFDPLRQRCLLGSFDESRFLQKLDLQVIKRLGLKFRGPKSWPLFRSYLPGYYPWYLNREESIFLTTALTQAKEVALRLEINRDWFNPPSENDCLVRMPEETETGFEWRDEWLKLPHPKKEEFVIPPLDEIRLQKIKKTLIRRQGIWEGDLSYVPFPIHQGERPYFPFLLLWVEHSSGFILKGHLLEPLEYRVEFQNHFLEIMEHLQFLPEEVWVKREEVFKLLELITSKLGIKLRLHKKLPALEKVQESMEDAFLKRDF